MHKNRLQSMSNVPYPIISSVSQPPDCETPRNKPQVNLPHYGASPTSLQVDLYARDLPGTSPAAPKNLRIVVYTTAC